MNYSEIYKKTEAYVTVMFETEIKPNLIFHTLKHTRYVVVKCAEIAAHYQLTEQDMMVLYVSAWFHDTGYLFTTPAMHEEESVVQLKKFIEPLNLPHDVTYKMEACILSTKNPRRPNGLLEQIINDADTFNLGTNEFKATNKEVYEECKMGKPAIDLKRFDCSTLDMLKDHQYFTSYCKDLLNDAKKKNLKKLDKKNKQRKEELPAEKISEIYPSDSLYEVSEKSGTTKGMQTMLRITSSNHMTLSEMADSKANILISVNAIIISVILSVLLRKLQSDPYLTIPTLIFLTFAVVTIVISIIATRPKVNLGVFNEEDVINKKTNLLFFGNFHKMELLEYERAMKIMMKDADYLYGSLIQDIYYLGTVLGKKYRLIRLAYTVFMVGIVLSVIAFAVASVHNGSQAPPIAGETGASPF